MNTPTELKYTESHEWIKIQDGIATVGITDHAQNELSDVVFVELSALGKTVTAGQTVAVVESVKAASDIYAPIAGEILEGNGALEAEPGIVNADPYGNGWIFKIKPTNPAELDALKSAEEYEALTS